MKKLLITISLFLGFAITSTAQVVGYNQYATTIAVMIPTAPATNVATFVPAGAPTVSSATLKNTFRDTFATFNLADKVWTPHKDARWNPTYKQWGGYANRDNRYQKAMAEQQTYVDPGFWGGDQSPLFLNPFSLLPSGQLVITARETPVDLVSSLFYTKYTSGLISSRKSFTQKYGYFEARIKVPYAQGLLAAFWMLNADDDGIVSWPPEYDIMEAPTHKGEIIQTSVHSVTATDGTGCENPMKNFKDDFHVYGMLWTPIKTVFYIDRVPVCQVLTPATANKPMYMLLNLAIGGTWVGNVKDATVSLPATMIIDQVSAFSETGVAGCIKRNDGALQCE